MLRTTAWSGRHATRATDLSRATEAAGAAGRGVYDGIGRVDVGEVRPLVRREEGRDTSSRRRIDTSRDAVEGGDTIGAVAERYAWATEAAGE